MTDKKHTPTPWNVEKETDEDYDETGALFICHQDTVCDESTVAKLYLYNKEANANHIVLCVNAHDELIEACEAAYESLGCCSSEHEYLVAERLLMKVLNKGEKDK